MFMEHGRLNPLEEQGFIQAFEYTHELAWKTLSDLLKQEGYQDLLGSKDVTRKAFSLNLIENGDAWMDMIKSRNLTVHSYNEEIAKSIILATRNAYYPAFLQLEKKTDWNCIMPYGLGADTIKKMQDVFARYPQIHNVILYGSRAKGTYHPGSDIDLTLQGYRLDLHILATIHHDLDDLLMPYTVDLSLLDTIEDKDLLDHIKRVGIDFYAKVL